MASNITIFIKGRAGRDAEQVALPGKAPFWKFSMAVEGGTKENPRTTWFEILDYSKNPKSRFVTKGMQVAVWSDSIYASSYTSKKDNKFHNNLNVFTYDVIVPQFSQAGQDAEQLQEGACDAEAKQDEYPF
jgi:hypothetical protein